jgi:DNA-binding transcriptional ArsR family regulator
VTGRQRSRTVFGTYRTANSVKRSSGAEAARELAGVLADVGLQGEEAGAALQAEHQPDLLLDLGDRRILVEVKERATVTPAQVATLIEAAANRTDSATVVVADRVTEKAREMLREAGIGWFDRRGHLRVVAPGILVDTEVRVPTVTTGKQGSPLRRRAVLEVATWLMSDPPQSTAGVRELARILSLSPSSVSDALADLRAEGLVSKAGIPVLPELFWEAVDHWSTPRQALASEPQPGDASGTEPLHLGIAVAAARGWALTDTLAAAAYGAPVGVRSGAPPDFLVPTKQVVRLAAITLGTTTEAERGCTVREAPVTWACERRIDGSAFGASTPWPLAHPLVVAIDLASDPGRGREVLESWTPPKPWHRVW